MANIQQNPIPLKYCIIAIQNLGGNAIMKMQFFISDALISCYISFNFHSSWQGLMIQKKSSKTLEDKKFKINCRIHKHKKLMRFEFLNE